MSPLVLLILLAFFFAVALAFTVWAALSLGDAARRAAQPAARPARRGAEAQRARTPKPWEKVPEPAAERERRRTRRRERAEREPAPREAQREAPAQPAVARNSLWEAQPPPPKVTARPADEPAGGRAVVTPRQRSDDAFERFLESEKRRD